MVLEATNALNNVHDSEIPLATDVPLRTKRALIENIRSPQTRWQRWSGPDTILRELRSEKVIPIFISKLPSGVINSRVTRTIFRKGRTVFYTLTFEIFLVMNGKDCIATRICFERTLFKNALKVHLFSAVPRAV